MKPWEIWLRGILAAAISGVGTALTGSSVGLTPLQMRAMIFSSVAITVGAYLKQSPLPDQK